MSSISELLTKLEEEIDLKEGYLDTIVNKYHKPSRPTTDSGTQIKSVPANTSYNMPKPPTMSDPRAAIKTQIAHKDLYEPQTKKPWSKNWDDSEETEIRTDPRIGLGQIGMTPKAGSPSLSNPTKVAKHVDVQPNTVADSPRAMDQHTAIVPSLSKTPIGNRKLHVDADPYDKTQVKPLPKVKLGLK